MSCKGKFLKRFNQKLSNNKISLFIGETFLLMDILLNFLKVIIQFINFLGDDMINLFLAFGDKLLEYCDNFV